jgi:hypothetical protein
MSPLAPPLVLRGGPVDCVVAHGRTPLSQDRLRSHPPPSAQASHGGRCSWRSESGKHCGPAALGLSGARRQLGGGRPRGEGRGRSARGARPPGRGPGYAQALDEILPTNKSDLCQLAATQTAGLVVGNLRSSACAALRAARVAMMALIISFACHTVWH